MKIREGGTTPMGNEQKIIDRIIQDAQKEADDILTAARKEAAEIIHIAKEKADKELGRYQKLSEAEAEKTAAKEISGAEMEAKKQILTKKQELLAAVLSDAEAQLLHLDDEAYARTIGEMLSLITKRDGQELIVSEQDAKRLAPVIAEKGFILSADRRDISGGFIVKENEIEYNYSFSSMIAIEREQLEQLAAELLFH